MKTPKLFKCEIASAEERLVCDHSIKHPIMPGDAYCRIGTPRGQKKPICRDCSVEMIIAAHAQLKTLMEGFDPNAVEPIDRFIHERAIRAQQPSTPPRRMFKTDIRQSAVTWLRPRSKE
jgi:hypothetical protein